jgi:hypothetical protein
LGRLLGDYERLTRNEGAALRAQDFPALAEIFSLKQALLLQITTEGSALGLDCRVRWFDDCLAALAGMERDNVSFAARVLVQMKVQRESLAAARKRLRGLGRAYRQAGSDGSRLFARS